MGNAESNNNNNHEEDISLPEIPRENGIFSFGDEDLFHQESTESEYNFSDDEDDRKAKDDTIMSERYVNNPLQKQDSVTSITREKSMQPRWKKILTQLRKEREKNNKIKSDGYTDKLKLSTKELERTHSGSLTKRMSKRFSFLNLKIRKKSFIYKKKYWRRNIIRKAAMATMMKSKKTKKMKRWQRKREERRALEKRLSLLFQRNSLFDQKFDARKDEQNLYCRLCDKRFKNNPKGYEQHINGRKHRARTGPIVEDLLYFNSFIEDQQSMVSAKDAEQHRLDAAAVIMSKVFNDEHVINISLKRKKLNVHKIYLNKYVVGIKSMLGFFLLCLYFVEYPCTDFQNNSVNDTCYFPQALTLGVEFGILILYMVSIIIRLYVVVDPSVEHNLLFMLLLCMILFIDAISVASVQKYRSCAFLRAILVLQDWPITRHLHTKIFKTFKGLGPVLMLSLFVFAFFVVMARILFPNGTLHGDSIFPTFIETVNQFTFLMFGAVNYPDIMLPDFLVDTGIQAFLLMLVFVLFMVVLILNLYTTVVYSLFTQESKIESTKSFLGRRVGIIMAFQILGNTKSNIDISDRDIIKDAGNPDSTINNGNPPQKKKRRSKVKFFKHYVSVVEAKSREKEVIVKLYKSTFMELFDRLALLNVRKYSQDQLKYLWEECSQSDDAKFISPLEFMDLTRLAKLKTNKPEVYQVACTDSATNKFLYGGFFRKTLRPIISSRIYRYALMILVALNTIYIFIYIGMDSISSSQQAFFNALDISFVTIFILEMIVNILAVGLISYIKTRTLRFDGLINVASFFGLVAIHGAPKLRIAGIVARMSNFLKFFRILRAVRVLRFINFFDELQIIIAVLSKILRPIVPLLLIFFMYLVMFASFGITLFYDKLVEDNPKIESTGFAMASVTLDCAKYSDENPSLCQPSNAYYNNVTNASTVPSYLRGVNFQNFRNAFIATFHFFVQNNWHMTFEALYANNITSNGWWFLLWCFFIMFHITMQSLIMNVVLSFLFDAYAIEMGDRLVKNVADHEDKSVALAADLASVFKPHSNSRPEKSKYKCCFSTRPFRHYFCKHTKTLDLSFFDKLLLFGKDHQHGEHDKLLNHHPHFDSSCHDCHRKHFRFHMDLCKHRPWHVGDVVRVKVMLNDKETIQTGQIQKILKKGQGYYIKCIGLLEPDESREGQMITKHIKVELEAVVGRKLFYSIIFFVYIKKITFSNQYIIHRPTFTRFCNKSTMFLM